MSDRQPTPSFLAKTFQSQICNLVATTPSKLYKLLYNLLGQFFSLWSFQYSSPLLVDVSVSLAELNVSTKRYVQLHLIVKLDCSLVHDSFYLPFLPFFD